MNERTDKGTAGGRPPEGGLPPGNRKRRRWGVAAKTEVVMRVLRGEGIDAVSRECRVSASELAAWRDEFIHAGTCGLKSRKTDPAEERLRDAQAKIGDLTLRLEIAEAYLKKKGVRL